MNKVELRALLTSKNISTSKYTLDGGLPNEKLCLEQQSDGVWKIYYSERGGQTILSTWESEDEACAEFLRVVQNY